MSTLSTTRTSSRPATAAATTSSAAITASAATASSAAISPLATSPVVAPLDVNVAANSGSVATDASPPPEHFADVPVVDRAAAATKRTGSADHVHIPALDGLRGLAIILVLFFHFMLVEGNSPLVRLIQKTWGFGWVGVDLFFVLSGFLITGILFDAKKRPHYFRNFYARRTVRIFPLYYAFLVVMLLLLPALLGRATMVAHLGEPPIGQWSYWLYLYNLFQGHHGPTFSHSLGVTWSLCIEEQFYLLWPTVVWLCSGRTLLKVCGALMIISLLCRLLLVVNGYGEVPVSQWTFCRMDALAVGAALAVVLKSGMTPLSTFRRPAQIIVLAVPVVILVLNLRGGKLMHNPIFLVGGYSALAAMFGSLLLLTVTSSTLSPLSRFFTNPLMRMFGRFSYAIYLFNQPVKFLLRDYVLDPNVDLTLLGSHVPCQMLFFALATAITVALAWSSWHVFEKHFLKLKERFPMSAEAKGPATRQEPQQPQPGCGAGPANSIAILEPGAAAVAAR